MGVWIEITGGWEKVSEMWVTPFMGVWIEICLLVAVSKLVLVTPFMGVWIEIMNVWSTNVAHKRLQRGSHIEGHMSHILSDRMSSSQMGYIIGTTKKCKEVHRKAGEMRTLKTAAISSTVYFGKWIRQE